MICNDCKKRVCDECGTCECDEMKIELTEEESGFLSHMLQKLRFATYLHISNCGCNICSDESKIIESIINKLSEKKCENS